MSTDNKIDHEILNTHLAKIELEPNDFVILGVRPTDNEAWYQVAVAQHIVRGNDQGTTVFKEDRVEFGRGAGDPNWGMNKARRHWDTLTMEDIKTKYKDVPELIKAAEVCAKSDSIAYTLVSDEEGKPIVNPMYKHTDGNKYPFVLDIWEDHQVESEWDAKNITRSAKQNGEGVYLFKNYGGELANGNWSGGKNFAIFTHYAVNVGKARREFKQHDGVTRDVKQLTIQPAENASLANLPGIAGSAENKQASGESLDGKKEPTTAGEPGID